MRNGGAFLKTKAGLLCAALVSLLYLAGCGPSSGGTTAGPLEAGAQTQAHAASSVRDYVLGVGDKLRLKVFGEENLSGEFQVSSTGLVSLPLIGDVRAAGLTVTQLQSAITRKLSDGYMKDPRVSLEISGYRPFFIVGEVMKPGSYNYENGMAVINAVALAGGYTYRADKDEIKLKHASSGHEERVTETTSVLPGDVITVPERFF